MVITLDGPSASGKSTLGKALAQRLGFYYLSTGILYRGVAYIVFHRLFTPSYNPAQLTETDLAFIEHFSYSYENNSPILFYNNENITSYLFTAERDQESSIISSFPLVRAALLSLQRSFAKKYNLIAEGRDCGSLIFPDALHKFYITASLDIRTQRKMNDYSGTSESIKNELATRDDRDIHRKVAPLIIPKNAIVIDTSSLTVEEALNEIITVLNQ